ncbi:MAG: EAL domain-containing protein, partial [Nitriliruptoraceae bacterium]
MTHLEAHETVTSYTTAETLLGRWRTHQRGPLPDAVAELAGALTDERVYVAYQPIVRLSDGQVAAVEALIRLDDPANDELSTPLKLIAVAEEHGLIEVVGRYVMERTCRQLAAWRTALPDLQAHVNVSPTELRDARYVEEIAGLLATSALPPDALVVEVTESAALDRESNAKSVLVGLANTGIVIALDDFGTGFASLDLLADTPARIVKLDRSFVAALGETETANRSRAVIMQAAIGMARSLGLQLVGEGVEEIGQARALLSWGCDFGQGFLYGRPTRPEVIDPAAWHVLPKQTTALLLGADTLTPEAVDVGISLAGVLSATDPDGGDVRAAAISAASTISAVLGASRERADTAGMLASIVDLDVKLERFGIDLRTLRPSLAELRTRLSITPVIGRNTSAGAIARTAWALAQSRARGDAAPDPALLAAHPDPDVDRELHTRVEEWWHNTAHVPSVRNVLLTLEERLRSRGDANERLRSLVALARAIGSDGDLLDVLEVTAGEAIHAVRAASLSIVQLHDDGRTFQVLVNVGDLADWEKPRPADEIYTPDDLPVSTTNLLNRSMHIEVLGHPEGNQADQDLLRSLGKDSAAYVPLFIDGDLWGAMFVSTAPGTPVFTLADGPFLSAVASFVSVAIGRAEQVGRLRREVLQDALTDLPNRRYLEEAFVDDTLLATATSPVCFAVLHVHGVRLLNDTLGYAAGDAELLRTADLLRPLGADASTMLAGRLSGSDFYIVARRTREELRVVLEELAVAYAADAPELAAL